MGKNPLTRGGVSPNTTGIGPATRGRIHTRARELAVIAGRAPHQVSPTDYNQARRELAGEPDADPQDATLAAFPESKRGDPVPGSDGRQAPESSVEDDDDEGHNESAQLVAEGVNAAARDQMLGVARAAAVGKSPSVQP